jgi:hypothetical protein
MACLVPTERYRVLVSTGSKAAIQHEGSADDELGAGAALPCSPPGWGWAAIVVSIVLGTFVGIMLLDIAVPQSDAAVRVAPEARSRFNTAFATGNLPRAAPA